MLEFSFRLWNIHTTGQYEKWKVTKEFIMSLLCSKFIDLLIMTLYHALAKFDSQKQNLSLLWKCFARLSMSSNFSLLNFLLHLMRVTLSNKSCVILCVTFARFSSNDNFCVLGKLINCYLFTISHRSKI